jgi:hypothetical protein
VFAIIVVYVKLQNSVVSISWLFQHVPNRGSDGGTAMRAEIGDFGLKRMLEKFIPVYNFTGGQN